MLSMIAHTSRCQCDSTNCQISVSALQNCQCQMLLSKIISEPTPKPPKTPHLTPKLPNSPFEIQNSRRAASVWNFPAGAWIISPPSVSDGPVSASEGEDEDENEFYDALQEGGSSGDTAAEPTFTLNIPTGHRRNSSDSSDETDEAQETHKVRCIFLTVFTKCERGKSKCVMHCYMRVDVFTTNFWNFRLLQKLLEILRKIGNFGNIYLLISIQ